MLQNVKRVLVLLILIVLVEKSRTWSTGRYLLFDKLGEFGMNVVGFSDECINFIFFSHSGFKQYFVSKVMNPQWYYSRKLCEEYGMEFARLEFSSEAGYILTQLASYTGSTGVLTLNVDATTLTPGTTGWRWVRSNYPIDYTINWATGEPNGGTQACLAVGRKASGLTGFEDIACTGAAATRRVLCQIKHENFLHRILNSQGK